MYVTTHVHVCGAVCKVNKTHMHMHSNLMCCTFSTHVTNQALALDSGISSSLTFTTNRNYQHVAFRNSCSTFFVLQVKLKQHNPIILCNAIVLIAGWDRQHLQPEVGGCKGWGWGKTGVGIGCNGLP